jgi:cytidylate kinase
MTMLITISRQFGAGGSLVAQLVAEKLGWSVIDNELVNEVARRIGKPAEEIAEREERVPSFVERLSRALVASPEVPLVTAAPIDSLDEAELVKVTEVVVAEAAQHGRVVLVGRAAVAVLARESGAIHVQLVAPRPFRIQVVSQRSGIDARAAEKQIGETDAQRARYHKQYYNRDWSEPVNYHLVINTGAVGFAGAAEVIVARARALGW